MNKNNPSAPGVSHTTSLDVDAEFDTLMDELTLEAGGPAQLAATGREQALMDHQHKLWGSEAQVQSRQGIRETEHETMESSETTTRLYGSKPNSHGDSSIEIAQRGQQSSMAVHYGRMLQRQHLGDETYRKPSESNTIPAPRIRTMPPPGHNPQPGTQPSRTVVSPDPPPPRLPDIRGYHEGKFMSKYDVRYVSSQQIKPLASEDPYKDDFYYHTYLRRTQEKAGDGSLPPAMMPLSKDVKDNTRMSQRDKDHVIQTKTRAWEGDHKILGHFPRASVSQPRLLLLISELQEMDYLNEKSVGDDESKKGGAGFTSQLWKARVSIMRANDVLLNVEELMNLLAFSRPTHDRKAYILGRLQDLIDDLGCSLGLPSQNQMEGVDDTACGSQSKALEAQLDLYLLAKVLELPKGKKAITRSVPLLYSDQRWALVPSIIAIMLARHPPTSTDSIEIEEEMFTMVKSLVVGIKNTRTGVNRPPAPLSAMSRCVELILISHRERKGSLKASLGCMSRAELLQTILECGSEVCDSMPRSIQGSQVELWKSLHEEFLELVSSS